MRYQLFLLLCACSAICGPVEDWAAFEKQVRDQVISKDSSRSLFPPIYGSLLTLARRFSYATQDTWDFPVKGRTTADAGKGGFKPYIYYGGTHIRGYDFFDGNLHGGHPAYDIFIADKNQDSRDDKTGEQVYVVVPCDMLIISSDSLWRNGSDMRGGNYIWALSPQSGELVYFAHLDSILVRGGSFVQSRTRIGTVGRTGKNAARRESATHLHMMVLLEEDGRLQPVDFLHYFPERPKQKGAGVRPKSP